MSTSQSRSPGQAEPTALELVLERAARSAAGALAQMSGQLIDAGVVGVHMVPLSELALVAGDPERPAIALYLGVEGELTAHVLIILSEPMARELVDLLLGEPPGTTGVLGELEISALGEVGNIAGARFINTLADSANLPLPPTPPVVLHDMCGAVLDSLASALAMAGDEAMVIETQFQADGRSVELMFLMLPGQELIRAATGEGREEVAGVGAGN